MWVCLMFRIMGEVFVSGKDATVFLNKIVPQDITKLDYEKLFIVSFQTRTADLLTT